MKFNYNLNYSDYKDHCKTLYEIQKAYKDIIYTKRLKLRKEPTPDFVSTVYSILLKSSDEKIGQVTLIYDGEILYKVYKSFRNNGYATEAVSKLIEISKLTYFYLSIDFFNIASRKVAKKLGFKRENRDGKTLTFVKNK